MKSHLIPAKYIGAHAAVLSGTGPYYNIDGTRRTSMALDTGDEIMMPDKEVLGQTMKFDPNGIVEPLLLGAGRVVLPEHAQLNDQALAEEGYEFHMGRPDFEALNEALKPRVAISPSQTTSDENAEVASLSVDSLPSTDAKESS